ncbi:phosphatidylinositol-specific phospholipase C/glycerophosphodiester phosphodiesterase family protein [Novipirellula sp. SH528]|uniref:phosphatidylinositol-specific phospholipase C/glycerophosphodiester phosphodiesterase family protein n=1 Tax=Novipirellula sp. SH528 TaxID=3454466 RepID=UPI003F9FA46F
MKRLQPAMILSALIIVAMVDRPAFCQTNAAPPLALAHAHNDYAHTRPLLDALDHGFTSVEADIYLVEGELWVAHSQNELKPERTLQSLYLNPLRERVQQNNGSVHGTDDPFYLLIDIKSAAEPTYAALAKTLAQYSEMISVVRDGKLHRKAVSVTVSGNRPLELMTAETVRYAGVDGRLSDLDSRLPSHLMPLISDNWRTHFRWNGKGTISAADQQKLDQTIASAHAQGRRVRFWATPDTAAMWRVLRDSGVDMINTDDLPGLESFLRQAGKDR